MKGLIRDDTSWSINLGTAPCVPAMAVSGITVAIGVCSGGPETDQHDGGELQVPGILINKQRPCTELRGAAPGRPMLLSRGLILSWQTHAAEWIGCFEGTDWVLHTVYCIIAEPLAASPHLLSRPAVLLCAVLGSMPRSGHGLMGNHTAPPSCCKHETQGVLAEPASGAECECNGEMLP